MCALRGVEIFRTMMAGREKESQRRAMNKWKVCVEAKPHSLHISLCPAAVRCLSLSLPLSRHLPLSLPLSFHTSLNAFMLTRFPFACPVVHSRVKAS